MKCATSLADDEAGRQHTDKFITAVPAVLPSSLNSLHLRLVLRTSLSHASLYHPTLAGNLRSKRLLTSVSCLSLTLIQTMVHPIHTSAAPPAAFIPAPSTFVVPSAYYTSPEVARYIDVALASLPRNQHISLHSALQNKRSLPHRSRKPMLLLPPSDSETKYISRLPLLLPPVSPKSSVFDQLCVPVSDNCSIALCFRFLDWPSLLACRRVSRVWNEQSRSQFIGDGRGWTHKRDALTLLSAASNSCPPLSPANERHRLSTILDNSYVRSLCTSLPFLRLLELSKYDKLSRVDPISERALAYIATLSSLTSLTLNHYNVAVSDRSCLHLCKLQQLRTLSLSACRRITSQALLYLSTSPVARSLTSLDLSSCCGLTDVSALRDMRSLTSVDLSECRRLTVSSLSSALSKHPLVKLSVRGTHTTAKALSFLIHLPATITSLDLRSTDVDDSITHVLSQLRQTLSILRLADCIALSSSFLPSLMSLLQTDDLPTATLALVDLVYLDLARLPNVVTDNTLALLPSLTPNLQVLSVASTSITTTQPLGSLSRLHSLDADLCHSLHSLQSLSSLPLLRLSLWDCQELSNHQLLPLMACHTLRHLNLCGCRAVTAHVWEGWNERAGMAGLQRLNVRFCDAVPSEVESLRAARPALTLLV